MSDQPLRPEIAQSWLRSERSGLSPERISDLDHSEARPTGRLLRAAGPVLDALAADLDGTSTGLILADRSSRIVDVRVDRSSVHDWMYALGVAPGVRFGEDNMGTNSIGTPLEVRKPMAVRGTEHFTNAFKNVSCYGHPIVDPVTGRCEGVLDISSPQGQDSPLFPALVRRVVRDIGDQLQASSPRSHLRLAAAFEAATRIRSRAVLAIGPSIVLATPTALDALDARDHVVLRACADEIRAGGIGAPTLQLSSGLAVRLTWQPVHGTDGVVITLAPGTGDDQGLVPGGPVGLWPVLVIGEPGSGRTTAARRALQYPADGIDAVDAFGSGAERFARQLDRLFSADRRAVLVENVQLLADPLAARLVRHLQSYPGRVALTSTPATGPSDPNARFATVCPERVELSPLRMRRQEIPDVAVQMLAQTSAGGTARLLPATLRALAAQTWPGNLSELRRVIDGLARSRSAGDITPDDLPASHRTTTNVSTPREQAERAVILAALDAAHGNKIRAAQTLAVSRSTLYNRIRALHIDG